MKTLGKILKVALLTASVLFAVSAAIVFVLMEQEAAAFCARATYHSGECADIRSVQHIVAVFGIPAAIPMFVFGIKRLFRMRLRNQP